jgi:hypothetical protein
MNAKEIGAYPINALYMMATVKAEGEGAMCSSPSKTQERKYERD